MLKSFTISNYKVFNDQTTIDFSNVRDYRFNEECIKSGLINKAVMYGKNAIGKSSLGEALIDIRNTILPNERPSADDIGFVNANAVEQFARFEYTFLINGQEIKYIYEKTTNTKLKYESLTIDNNFHYSFDFEKQKGDLDLIKQHSELKHLNLDEWNNEIAILRYILTNSKLNELVILKELSSFVKGIALLKPSDNMVHFRGPKVVEKSIMRTIIELDLAKDLEVFLNECGLELPLKVDATPEGEKRLYFNYDRPIDFIRNASSGTLALTAMYIFIKNLSDIKFLYIDEFDANFHFELAEKILEEIKKQTDCQILLTTHNTDLMNNKFMRPDCYFLMMPNKITALSDATPRELRQGHNLEKLYQSGEFK